MSLPIAISTAMWCPWEFCTTWIEFSMWHKWLKNTIHITDMMVCWQQERLAVIRTLGPALAVLAEVLPHLAFANTMAADSPIPSSVSEDITVVTTSDQLLDAINSVGVRHVVIRSHLNITSPDTSSSAQLRTALLRLPQSTKHIQVYHFTSWLCKWYLFLSVQVSLLNHSRTAYATRLTVCVYFRVTASKTTPRPSHDCPDSVCSTSAKAS